MMAHTPANIIVLLFAVLLLTAPAAAADAGQTTVGGVFSEVIISADMPVSLAGYTVNEVSGVERITVLPLDRIVISVNATPPGMVLKTVVTISGEEKMLFGNPVTLTGFSPDTPESILVRLSFAFPPAKDPGSGGSSGVIPTYTPTAEPTQAVPTIPVEPTIIPEDPKAGDGWNILPLILAAGIAFLLILLYIPRKLYRILKSYAKKYGFDPERDHLKAIAKAIRQMLLDTERYPNWRKNPVLAEKLRADVIRKLDEMQYYPVPREEVSQAILKAGRGKFTRYWL